MNPIVIGYDGSDGARYAVEFGGALFAGREAIVVTALEDWPAVVDGDTTPSAAVDAAARADAARIAREGAELARASGFVAVGRVEIAPRSAWQTLVRVADAEDAALILVGSHGFGGLRPLVLGSVSHSLSHHAHQPVLAVPAPSVVAARREHTTTKAAAA